MNMNRRFYFLVFDGSPPREWKPFKEKAIGQINVDLSKEVHVIKVPAPPRHLYMEINLAERHELLDGPLTDVVAFIVEGSRLYRDIMQSGESLEELAVMCYRVRRDNATSIKLTGLRIFLVVESLTGDECHELRKRIQEKISSILCDTPLQVSLVPNSGSLYGCIMTCHSDVARVEPLLYIERN
jgi:hypothetical protein